MAFLRQFNIKLLTGDPVEFAVVGNYVRIKTSTYDVELKDLTKNDNNSFVLSEGDDVVFDENFKKLSLRNLGSGDITVTIVIGLDVKLSSSKVGGTVKVVNGEIERVKAGQCFWGCSSVGGVAGQYQLAQLWNPAGSGKKLVLNKITVYISTGNTALGLLKSVSPLANISALVALNKDISLGVGVASLRGESSASIGGSPFGNVGVPVANQSVEVPFSEPILISEGSGIAVYSATPNVNMNCNFQWYEEIV